MPVIPAPIASQGAAGAATSYPALRIASNTACSLRKLSTATVRVPKPHATFAVGSIALIAFSIAAVQCPQFMSGILKLLIFVSFTLEIR